MSIQVYKKIHVQIKGLTPLLMNRLNPETLKSKTRMRTQDYSTEKDAANSAYVFRNPADNKDWLYVPQECLYSMLINTAKQYKIKRMSLASLLAGTMRIAPEKVPLLPLKNEKGQLNYIVDERAVVIQSQRVLKGRAKISSWILNFDIVYDARRLPDGIEATIKEILEDAGTRMGLLDYRPQHRGWFGTFVVVSFESAEVSAEEQVTISSSGIASHEETPIAEAAETEEDEETPTQTHRGPGRPKKKNP